MIYLDYKDKRPIYEQIVEKFSDLIVKGVIVENEKMPSVRTLAMELSINPNTIQRAYQELERSGYIYSSAGKGSFVSPRSDFIRSRHTEVTERLKAALKEAIDVGVHREIIETIVNQYLEGSK